MASGSASAIYHSTASGTADVVTLTGANWRLIEIVNRGSGDIFATTDGTTVPTASGAETWVIPANSSAVLPNLVPPDETYSKFPPTFDVTHGDTKYNSCVVKLISSGTPAYTVSGKPVARAV